MNLNLFSKKNSGGEQYQGKEEPEFQSQYYNYSAAKKNASLKKQDTFERFGA